MLNCHHTCQLTFVDKLPLPALIKCVTIYFFSKDLVKIYFYFSDTVTKLKMLKTVLQQIHKERVKAFANVFSQITLRSNYKYDVSSQITLQKLYIKLASSPIFTRPSVAEIGFLCGTLVPL